MLVLLLLIAGIALIVFLFVQQKSFGGKPEGKRLERIIKSHNYKNGSFQNLSDTPMMAADASYFKLLGMYLWNKQKTEPDSIIPSVKRNLNEKTSGKPTLTWFGHSSYLVQLQGLNILVDPVFSERASPVQYFGSKSYNGTMVYSISDFPAIDVVLISHDHYDHLDYETIKKLGNAGKFYVPLGVGAHLEVWGIAPEKIVELDWWEGVKINHELELIATPARHFSGRGITGRNQTLWASYVLRGTEHSIYIGGDSGYDRHFKEIGEKYGPFDLALLECGQYNAYWPYIHMLPEQTAQAAIDLKAKVLQPVHWSKFTLALHPWNEPVERLMKKAKELHLKTTIPMIGEKVVLDSSYPELHWWNIN